MQVRRLRCCGAARVQHDDLRAMRRTGGEQALVQHRVAPGGIAADQDDQVGVLEVLIDAGDDVFPEGSDVAGDRGRHAQARIGVDIGAADEAFHQLVGDIVVLGQALAGDIEGHAVRPVQRDGLAEARGDQAQRVVQRRGLAGDRRCREPGGVVKGRAEGRAFGTKPAAVRGVGGVGRDGAAGPSDHAAANTAIGACGVNGRRGR